MLAKGWSAPGGRGPHGTAEPPVGRGWFGSARVDELRAVVPRGESGEKDPGTVSSPYRSMSSVPCSLRRVRSKPARNSCVHPADRTATRRRLIGTSGATAKRCRQSLRTTPLDNHLRPSDLADGRRSTHPVKVLVVPRRHTSFAPSRGFADSSAPPRSASSRLEVPRPLRSPRFSALRDRVPSGGNSIFREISFRFTRSVAQYNRSARMLPRRALSEPGIRDSRLSEL